MEYKICKNCNKQYIPKLHDTNSIYCSLNCRKIAYTYNGKKDKTLYTSKLWKSKNKERVRLYSIWKNMIERCYREDYKEYYLYGGRGITICNDWLNDFDSFYTWAINNNYKIDFTKNRNDISIDRIDNDKGYSPENCRWVNNIVQARNKRLYSTNKTGVSGIRNYKNGYRVLISVNSKHKHIGCYKTLEEAIKARKNAEILYWGE